MTFFCAIRISLKHTFFYSLNYFSEKENSPFSHKLNKVMSFSFKLQMKIYYNFVHKSGNSKLTWKRGTFSICAFWNERNWFDSRKLQLNAVE